MAFTSIDDLIIYCLLILQFVAMITTRNVVSSGFLTLSPIVVGHVARPHVCRFVETVLSEETTKTTTSICSYRKLAEPVIAVTLR